MYRAQLIRVLNIDAVRRLAWKMCLTLHVNEQGWWVRHSLTHNVWRMSSMVGVQVKHSSPNKSGCVCNDA